MPNNIAHFAIHADDLDRAKAFYEGVFGWSIKPWGPPGFFMIQTGPDDEPGIHGSLQKRTEPRAEGGLQAFECTVGVEDVDATAASILTHGGTIAHDKINIVGVGWLVNARDPEGNRVGVMQYD